MKVLITGGYGNLGSWLTRHFCGQGHEVSILASRKRSILDSLDFKLIVCDITSATACKEALLHETFDVVIHTASVNDTFIDNYTEKSLLVNSLGTRNIIEALNKTSLRNFIYLSTFHVYGVAGGQITEESPLLTRHDYATTHLFAEYYVKQFHLTHALPYTIIRLTNSYGCPTDLESSKWYLILNDLSKMAFEKQQIVLKSNGLAARDFVWMGDVCEVLEKLSKTTASNDTFNLSGEQTFSMLEIAESVQKAYHKFSGETLQIQTNQEDKTTPGAPLFVSSAKIKKMIPYASANRFEAEAKKIFEFLS